MITKTTTYRVYLALDGSDLSYCGECSTLAEARTLAAAAPAGEEASLWDTRRAAGGTDGYVAPDATGVEADEACDWVGDYCIVATTYRS